MKDIPSWLKTMQWFRVNCFFFLYELFGVWQNLFSGCGLIVRNWKVNETSNPLNSNVLLKIKQKSYLTFSQIWIRSWWRSIFLLSCRFYWCTRSIQRCFCCYPGSRLRLGCQGRFGCHRGPPGWGSGGRQWNRNGPNVNFKKKYFTETVSKN